MINLKVVEYKKIWFSIPIILIIVGLIIIMINGGLNFGIDFTGGSTIQAHVGKNFDLSEVREIISKYDNEAVVTFAGNEKEDVIVRTKLELNDAERKEIIDQFISKFNIDSSSINFETVGPAIGKELKKQAILSLILANIGILIYISFRFEWRFGLASIIALIHDVIITIIIYGIMRIPVNSSFIAAILTIVGYSINNTIVIFDRIRENLKNAKKLDKAQLVNDSVNQTLIRTLNTSITTLLAIITLYVLGVPAIKDFALPLIAGITGGTYSSIFISGPLWVIISSNNKIQAGR